MNIDYRCTPSDLGCSLSAELDRLMQRVSREHGKLLNDWLERCVAMHCPEALISMERGDQMAVTRILNDGDFHYRCLPDSIVEFLQGDAVLARCKIEVKFNVSRAGQGQTPASRVTPRESIE